MEIINGYSYSLGLTPSNILSSDIATDNITESVNTKLFFFTGTMDLTALYNITSESSLLSTYASSYLGTVTAPLTYKFNKNKKTITIESATPNALRFKDPRYVNNSYIMGTSFTKPTIGAKYKFKIDGSTLDNGFLVNGSSINTNIKKYSNLRPHKLVTGVDGFDELFLNGYSVGGGEINFTNNTIMGYRVEGESSLGYRSITMQEMINKGYSRIVVVNNSSTNGVGFLGYEWNDKFLWNYNYSTASATYDIDLVNLTASVTASWDMSVDTTISLVGVDLSRLRMGVYAAQAGTGWQYWNVTLYTRQSSYDIESDFFTTTGNITVTNPTALTYSGFEVVPYDTDGNVLTNDINWVAMKTGSNGLGDKFIFTDEIGTSNSPAFVTMSNKTSKYGVENILSNLKLELHEKGV